MVRRSNTIIKISSQIVEMSNDLASTINCKIITPINSPHHTRISETTDIQNQRAHFAVGDNGVLSTDQVDQLGGTIKNNFYALYNKKRISTNIKSKKKAVEDIVKKLFKLQSGNSVKFRLYNKGNSKNNSKNNKKDSVENYVAYRSRQSKRYKYRIQLI